MKTKKKGVKVLNEKDLKKLVGGTANSATDGGGRGGTTPPKIDGGGRGGSLTATDGGGRGGKSPTSKLKTTTSPTLKTITK